MVFLEVVLVKNTIKLQIKNDILPSYHVFCTPCVFILAQSNGIKSQNLITLLYCHLLSLLANSHSSYYITAEFRILLTNLKNQLLQYLPRKYTLISVKNIFKNLTTSCGVKLTNPFSPICILMGQFYDFPT
jgi:hypothetical protein